MHLCAFGDLVDELFVFVQSQADDVEVGGRTVLVDWRQDYNRVRPYSALANQAPEAFRTQHIALAPTTGSGQVFTQGLSL